MRKNTTPSIAMAKRFLPTRFQERGETKRFSPGQREKINWFSLHKDPQEATAVYFHHYVDVSNTMCRNEVIH